jgi:hypothetical protein
VKKMLGGFVVFAAMIAILVGLIQLINWIPSAIQEGALQEYASIEDVRARLKIGTVYAPVYYPKSVQWPPALIAAQTRPYPAVVTHFRGSETPGETILIITQTALNHPPLSNSIRLTSVRETVRYPFKGRVAVLEVGPCQKDDTCSRMTWDEAEFRITLVMRSSPAELVQMAESMIPRSSAGAPPTP